MISIRFWFKTKKVLSKYTKSCFNAKQIDLSQKLMF